MEIRKVLALRGPNIWANFPVLEAWVDLGDLKDTSSEQMPGFNDRLKGWLPGLIEHRCSVGERGGFFQRLERGTYLAHILEHVTLELQTLAGTNVGFGKARETSEEGVYKVAIRYIEEDLGRACLETAHRLLLAAVHDQPFDIHAEVRKLRDLAHDVCLGPSTEAIVQAAKARGIPARRLNTGSLVQLGYGCKQRRIWRPRPIAPAPSPNRSPRTRSSRAPCSRQSACRCRRPARRRTPRTPGPPPRRSARRSSSSRSTATRAAAWPRT